jgi:MFS transporter, FHS family, glucose/mannose:H+ symporter
MPSMAQTASSTLVFNLPAVGRSLSGFLVSGFLFALVGALLPAWGYHLAPDLISIGNYFLCLAAGFILATLVSRKLLDYIGLGTLLLIACVIAWLTLIYLGFSSPPAHPGWRMLGMLFLGISNGLLSSGLFHVVTPAYHADPAGTVTIGGIFFGLGCLAAVMLVSGTFYAYTVTGILASVSLVPAMFAILYARTRWTNVAVDATPSLKQALRDFRSPTAVLLALLLFFQFGNEWALAGWLPLYLIRRLGMSPGSSLVLLGLYFSALLLGRLAALLILPRVRHTRMLFCSALVAQFGCIILLFTNNRFGAGTGVLFIGAGFASIYPLVAERIGTRFPYYHPGFFNGIFSFGLMGGLLAPASLGYLVDWLGMWTIVGLPFFGTFMVLLLVLVMWLEVKISG